jgi:[ribosomal protein S5]-alanine N-acetyltransferase
MELQLDFKSFPELHTERLLLRKISVFDVKEIFFLRSDAQMMKYIDKAPAKDESEALKWIEMIHSLQASSESLTWALSLKNQAQLIGTFCFWNIQKEHYRTEIGYNLHPAFQGKGIMREAAQAALDYGFTTIGFHSVEANVNPENDSSIALLERLRFTKEAHFKENYFYNGKFLDSAIYSLLDSVH